MKTLTRNALSAAVLALALGLTGCGAEEDAVGTQPTQPPASGDSTGAPAAGQTELTITVRESRDAEPTTWTLTCDPPGGDHPNPEAACAALAKAKNPFSPVPKDMACAEIFGGEQTATIEGTWQGKRVRAVYTRTNGCEIARWNAVAPALHIRGGA